MKEHATVSEDSRAEGERPLWLNALLVYEDFPTGLRARRTLERLVDRLKAGLGLRLNLWRFDLLREPTLRGRAAQEAAEADIVFVSTHGRARLPAAIHQWLEEWFSRKGPEPSALAVSLDPGAQRSAAARILAALDGLARLAHVDLFLDVGQSYADWESVFEEIHDRAEATTALMDGILHQPGSHSFRHLGINK